MKSRLIRFYVVCLFETVLTLLVPLFLSMMLDEMIYRKDLEEFFGLAWGAVMSVYSCALYYWLYVQHHYLMAMFTFEIKRDAFIFSYGAWFISWKMGLLLLSFWRLAFELILAWKSWCLFFQCSAQVVKGVFALVMAYFTHLSAAISDMDQKWNDAQTRARYVQKIIEQWHQ